MTSRSAVLSGFALALASALLLPSAARADIPPMGLKACEGKAKGDACKDEGDQAGTCQPDKCSKLDYSKGTPPSSVEWDCIRCKPAAAEPAVAPTPAAPAATPAATPAAPAAGAPAAPTPTPGPKAGGCSIASDGGGFGLLLLLAFGARRRRARR